MKSANCVLIILFFSFNSYSQLNFGSMNYTYDKFGKPILFGFNAEVEKDKNTYGLNYLLNLETKTELEYYSFGLLSFDYGRKFYNTLDFEIKSIIGLGYKNTVYKKNIETNALVFSTGISFRYFFYDYMYAELKPLYCIELEQSLLKKA